MNRNLLLIYIILLSLVLSCSDNATNTTPLPNSESVTISDKVWTAKNLNVDHYRNGDSIPEVRDSLTWSKLKTGAWCYYNNDPALGLIYGKLYNWFAVNDPRGLAPTGWHVPSNDEWNKLIVFAGGGTFAGGRLKEAGFSHWLSPNTNATNQYGFTALGSGYRGYKGSFIGFMDNGIWWTATESVSSASFAKFFNSNAAIIQTHAEYNELGFSVRCIKD